MELILIFVNKAGQRTLSFGAADCSGQLMFKVWEDAFDQITNDSAGMSLTIEAAVVNNYNHNVEIQTGMTTTGYR